MALGSPLARVLAVPLCALAWPMVSAVALAQEAPKVSKAECASSYEKSQELRSSGKLREARETLVVCAQEVCPAFVQSDCAQWLIEVQRELPTIVIAAKDKDGADTSAVKVTVDGEAFLTELDGTPAPINPGKHRLKFEIEGADPVEQQIVIRQGDKDRSISVSFAARGGDVPLDSPYEGTAPADAPAAPAEPPADEGKPGPLRPYAFIAGGVGAAGILGWVILGAVGSGKESDLRDKCAPSCAQSEVDSVQTTYLLADVSLGLGIAGLGAGVALFILSQPKSDDSAASDESASVDWGVVATPRSAFATVSGRF